MHHLNGNTLNGPNFSFEIHGDKFVGNIESDCDTNLNLKKFSPIEDLEIPARFLKLSQATYAKAMTNILMPRGFWLSAHVSEGSKAESRCCSPQRLHNKQTFVFAKGNLQSH